MNHREFNFFLNKNLFSFVSFHAQTDEYMSPGVYTYPFETELPSNLPTSCEGKYGFIRYLASVNIIRPMLPIQTQTIAFTVIKPHNLNALPVFQVIEAKKKIIICTLDKLINMICILFLINL